MRFLVAILFLFCEQLAFATGQVPDYLIYQGDTLAIFSNPLEEYFAQTGKKELPGFVGCGSTACWRGYKAIWELKNDSLYLRKITSCHNKCGLNINDVDLLKMFGTKNVIANWFSGQIRAPKGNLVQYVHIGYGSIYEQEQIFSFKNGKLKSLKVRSNKKITDKIYAQKRNWDLTKRAIDTIFFHIKRNVDWERLDSSKHMCDDGYSLSFNKNGHIKKVKFKSIGTTKQEKREDWWYNILEIKCRRTIKKALKDLDLDYLNPQAKFTVDIEIFFDSKEKILELWKPYDLDDEE